MEVSQFFGELIDERIIRPITAHQPVKHAVFGKPSHLHRVLLCCGVEAATLLTQQESPAVANNWHNTEVDFRRKTPIQMHLIATKLVADAERRAIGKAKRIGFLTL